MDALFVGIILVGFSFVSFGIPVFITALILEWRDRRKKRRVQPSIGKRALKIALAWAIMFAVMYTLYHGLRPLEEVIRFVMLYLSAVFSIWLIRKLWKFETSDDKSDG